MQSGLCGDCRHAKRIQTARSVFLLCTMSEREPSRYRKYPPLPVMACLAYESGAD